MVELVGTECAWVEFFVGRVVALLTADDVVFAVGGGEMVLVAEIASHAARVCAGDEVGQIQLIEEGGVGLADLVVGLTRLLLCGVEGVEVFHQEFTTSEQALTRPGFIAVFPRDLVQSQWEVLVGVDGICDDLGDFFLVCWTQEVFRSLAVLQA